MSKDIHKWSDGRYTLMFDEHTFFVWDNENDERMTALQTTKRLNEQQATINELKEENDKLIQKNCIPCELVNLQTREIDKLKEENEQLRQKLDFYLLDEFEWKEKYGA